MATRKGIGNAKRFRIFERDGFRCQYCGRTPPAVILQIDHVLPVSKGGQNNEENLWTSCLACNAGKRDRVIEPRAVPRDYASMSEDAAQRAEQLAAYRANVQRLRAEIDAAIDDVGRRFWGGDSTWNPNDEWGGRCRRQTEKFIELLGLEEVVIASEIAFAKCSYPSQRWKYFCGVCWTRATELGLRGQPERVEKA